MNFLPEQNKAINNMKNKKVGLLCLPTAAGKTVIIYGHARECFNDEKKHNFIISGPIMDLNRQTATSIISNLYSDGLINEHNCDIVIANCSNKKCNTYFTVIDNNKIDIVTTKEWGGREYANIEVNTADTKQEKQYRITVVCNPTLQNDEKFLNFIDKEIVNHFYFDECHTLKKDPINKNTTEDLGKDWVNYDKIFELISQDGTCYFVSATPTLDNFNTIIEHHYANNFDDCFVHRLTPYQAIQSRMIVEPKFKITKCSQLSLNSITTMVNVVLDDIDELKENDPNYIARVLITCGNKDDLASLEKKLITLYGNEYDVYSTCSAYGKKKNNNALSGDIKDFKDQIENNTRSCFILHIQQIIAGIDIPSFTHTIFNMCTTTNFISPIQITGRVLRPERRFANGEADLSVKKYGYVYINIEDNLDEAEKAARTLVDYYGAIFEFLKPSFFEGYTNGSNERHKRMTQFEDDITIRNFNNYIEEFMKTTAILIVQMQDCGVHMNVKTTIENDIKGKGYVDNLPVFYVPELTKYIDKVNNYITSINKFKNIGKITDCNMWLQLL